MWLGRRYKDLTEFADEGMPAKHDDSVAQLLETGTMSWYAGRCGIYETKHIELIKEIETRSAADPQKAYQDLLIAFLPLNLDFDYNGVTCRSVDDLLKLLEKDRRFVRSCIDLAYCGIVEARELKEKFERLNIKNAKNVTETYNRLHKIKDWYDSYADKLSKLGKSYRDDVTKSDSHLNEVGIGSGSASKCTLAGGFFGILTGLVLLAGLILLTMGYPEGLFTFGVALFILISAINSFGRANEIGSILRSHSVIGSLKNDVDLIVNSIKTGDKRSGHGAGQVVSIKETSDRLMKHSDNLKNICQAIKNKQDNVSVMTKAAYITSSLCFALMVAMLSEPFVMDMVAAANTGWGWLYDAAPIATIVVSVVSVIICIVAFSRHRRYSFGSFLLALASPLIGAAALGLAAILIWIALIILVIVIGIAVIFNR